MKFISRIRIDLGILGVIVSRVLSKIVALGLLDVEVSCQFKRIVLMMTAN